MAALCTCEDFILLSNGRTAGIVQFSSPDVIQLLNLPEAVIAAGTKQQHSGKKQKQIAKQSDGKSQEETPGQQEMVAEQGQDDRSDEENRILASAVSTDGQLVALCDDRKRLHVYRLEDGRSRLHFSSPLAHRCTSVTFTGNSRQVIVADKSGDAYVFDVQQEHSGYLSKAAGDAAEGQTVGGGTDTPFEDHHGRAGVGGSLLLGHHSMLLNVLTVDNDSLVVTSDRDEKIRISHYPDAYNIQAYCLGHTQFVISLAYDECRKRLISASGDATLRVWTLTGKELCCKSVLSDIPAEKVVDCALGVGNTTAALSVDTESNKQDASLSAVIASNKDKSRKAIQQICYCSDCQLLFVAIYKSPDILVYRLTNTNSDNVVLQFSYSLGGEGPVASMCVGRCVLWLVRQGPDQLHVEAFRMKIHHDMFKLEPVSGSKDPESRVLKTFSSQQQLLQVPAGPFDLIPSLWKTPFQGDLKYESNVKRHRENGSKKRSKKQKKLNQ